MMETEKAMVKVVKPGVAKKVSANNSRKPSLMNEPVNNKITRAKPNG